MYNALTIKQLNTKLQEIKEQCEIFVLKKKNSELSYKDNTDWTSLTINSDRILSELKHRCLNKDQSHYGELLSKKEL